MSDTDTVEMTDAEAQAVVDKWLRLSTEIGVWRRSKYHDDDEWIARDCSTQVGPLCGPPVWLRVTPSRLPAKGERFGETLRWIGEVRRMGSPHPRESAPDAVQLVVKRLGGGYYTGWDTPEEARAVLESLLHDQHDPEIAHIAASTLWRQTEAARLAREQVERRVARLGQT